MERIDQKDGARSVPFDSGNISIVRGPVIAVLLTLPLAANLGAGPWRGDSWYPLAKGTAWVYQTDYDEDTDIIHEVSGTEKVGETECFVVEHKSHNEKEKRTRNLRKEWLAAGEEGVMIHKVQRGSSELGVDKPFFKLKGDLRKGEEWEGEARTSGDPVKYHYLVEGEEDVQVPAGKYRAVKIRIKIGQGERHSAEGHEWYVKNVGLVKSEITLRFGAEGTTIVSELKEYRKAK